MSENTMQHEFRVTGHWQGGRAGRGQTVGDHISTTITLPQALGGAARGTNPEEMLASTAAACYLITLGIVLEKRGIATTRLEVTSTCTMDVEKLAITKLVHEPRILVSVAPTPEQRTSIAEAVHRAEQMCLISNAIRGTVAIELRWSSDRLEIVS